MSCFSILTSVLQDNFKFGPGSGCQVRVFPSRPGRRPGWAAFRGVAQFFFVYSAGDTAQGVKRGPSVTPSISLSTPSSQSRWARGSGRSSSSGQVARSECNPTRVGLGGRLGWSSLSGGCSILLRLLGWRHGAGRKTRAVSLPSISLSTPSSPPKAQSARVEVDAGADGSERKTSAVWTALISSSTPPVQP